MKRDGWQIGLVYLLVQKIVYNKDLARISF